jgi:hypothetical protein
MATEQYSIAVRKDIFLFALIVGKLTTSALIVGKLTTSRLPALAMCS